MANYNISSVDTSKLAASDVINCTFTGAAQSVTLPAGKYKLKVNGAQGGTGKSASGGLGGTATGTLTLKEATKIYVYVGGSGATGSSNWLSGIYTGGFNGGGYRDSYQGGGGATDIRIGKNSLYARVIVAGGGGAGGDTSRTGGSGGGATGGNGLNANRSSSYFGGYGGPKSLSSTSMKTYFSAKTQSTAASRTTDAYAGFGFGGNGIRYSGSSKRYGGAGGGGWYGGLGVYPAPNTYGAGGGGGSGYVYTADTAADYPDGCLLNSSYYLTDTSMSNGVITGNGSATITVVSITPPTVTVTWNANGGMVSIANQKVEKGKVIGTLPSATKSGYTLIGWFTAATGGTQITSSTVVSADVIYYAQWGKAYYAHSGIFADGTDMINVRDGDTVPTPKRQYFTFAGWEYVESVNQYWAVWNTNARVKFDGSWRSVSNICVKVDGEWRDVKHVERKNGSTWEILYNMDE